MFEKLRENPYFNEVVNFLKQKNLYESSYLVGGTVRDVMLEREIKDIDFAVATDTIELAREFAKKINGSFVLLDEVFLIGRVVKDELTIDFAQLRGNSIEADLAERDFTINAMATSLECDRLIDPFRGQEDLKNRLIRMVNEENLKADPLRVLRAYRFHATLSFEIEEKTRQALKNNAHLMKITARERIKDELWKIFSVPESFKTVQLMIEDEIFKAIFKTRDFLEIKPDIEALKSAEELLMNSKREVKNLSCFKFACLFDFLTSELIKQIKPARKEQRFVEDLIQAGARIRKIETLLDKVQFIRDFETILYPALVYGMSKDPLKKSRKWFYDQIEEFYKKIYLKNKKKLPIIKGEDIISLGFEPSPLVGEILDRIEILVLAGKISNKDQALEEIKKRFIVK
ncbi:poly(A) polymerase/tRNA nucleotidyltransferase [Thermodesulfovibrio aggregans]|uniref:Poly(A) polymerase/tRNA nucleotidyltransferase n=1 Tax=Thermodesulfovibrio aggregans TaxID=86166 RepID=A0A0U9IB84_9BACT|nr:CCA tRNA nucleotidyltransferase [Thermodesulfovibrio aggregans]GAQ95718.1 poly(A) polymerase/tRNA nucleotidyltransferase [Thermodesulfovibrio aggregans]